MPYITLGSPLSKATLDVEARVYSREFTHAIVSFDAGHNVGHFVWKSVRTMKHVTDGTN